MFAFTRHAEALAPVRAKTSAQAVITPVHAPKATVAQRADRAVDEFVLQATRARHLAIGVALDGPNAIRQSKSEIAKTAGLWVGTHAATSAYSVVSRRKARAHRDVALAVKPHLESNRERALGWWREHRPHWDLAPAAHQVALASLPAPHAKWTALPGTMLRRAKADVVQGATTVADTTGTTVGVVIGVTTGLACGSGTYALVRSALYFESDEAAHRQLREIHYAQMLADGAAALSSSLREHFASHPASEASSLPGRDATRAALTS